MRMADLLAPLSSAEKRGSAIGSGDIIGWRLLYRGSIGAFLVQAGGAALGLLAHAVIARLLGRAEYGVYTLTLTWISVLCVPALLGQSSGVVRLVAGYKHKFAWGELRGLRQIISLAVFAASIVISIAGALAVLSLRHHLGRELELTFLAGLVLLPVLALLQLSGALHRGLKRAASSGVFVNLVRPAATLSLTVALVMFVGQRLTAPIVMVASTIAAAVALACSEWSLLRAWPGEAKNTSPRYAARSWFALGRQLFFLAAMGIILNYADVLILGAFLGTTTVGPYYAAVQLAGVGLYGLNAVNTILAPMIAERYAADNHKELARLSRQAAWLMLAGTVTISVGTALLGRWVLGLFGPGFGVAYAPLLIILVGQCVLAAAGPAGFLMTMIRLEREASFVFGGGAMANIFLSVALIPHFGVIGAAVATTISTIVWSIASVVLVQSRLKLNATVFARRVR